MDIRSYMVQLMAEVILSDEAYNGDGLNRPEVWERFMQTLMEHMETAPDEEMRPALEKVDREQFQAWIDDPEFWDEINREIERRTQVLMTLMPSENEGHC